MSAHPTALREELRTELNRLVVRRTRVALLIGLTTVAAFAAGNHLRSSPHLLRTDVVNGLTAVLIGVAFVVLRLPAVQRRAGDLPAAAASSQQALSLSRDVRQPYSEAAYALNELGLVQQLTGDYPAAAASHQQALELCRDAGNRLGQAETLNCLGELASRTADSPLWRLVQRRACALPCASTKLTSPGSGCSTSPPKLR